MSRTRVTPRLGRVGYELERAALAMPGKRTRRDGVVTLSGGPALPPAMRKMWLAAGAAGDPAAAFCDCFVQAGCSGPPLNAHKLVLGSASEVLAPLLKKGCTVSVPSVSHQSMLAILNWLYLGSVDVPESSLPALIKAASALRLSALLDVAVGAVSECLAHASPSCASPLSPRVASSSSSVAISSATLATPASNLPNDNAAAVYILGGLHCSGSVERLCLRRKACTGLAAIPQLARHGIAVAARGAMVLACGGHASVCGGTSGSQVVDAVDVLDNATGQWLLPSAEWPPLSTPRAYAGAAVDSGENVFVLGGLGAGSRRLRTGEVLRPHAALWAPIAPMLSRRACVMPRPRLKPTQRCASMLHAPS